MNVETKMNLLGKLICIEGMDGVGKSTQARLLRSRLEKLNLQTVLVREPGGTLLGEKIRGLLLHDETVDITNRAEILLFMAARAQLYEEVTKPALTANKIIVTDRWAWSTIAYQTFKGVSSDEILNLIYFVARDVIPDITFILDVPVEETFKRFGRDEQLDKIERRGREYFDHLRMMYIWLVDNPKLKANMVWVDGEPDPQAVGENIWREIEKRFKWE